MHRTTDGRPGPQWQDVIFEGALHFAARSGGGLEVRIQTDWGSESVELSFEQVEELEHEICNYLTAIYRLKAGLPVLPLEGICPLDITTWDQDREHLTE